MTSSLKSFSLPLILASFLMLAGCNVYKYTPKTYGETPALIDCRAVEKNFPAEDQRRVMIAKVNSKVCRNRIIQISPDSIEVELEFTVYDGKGYSQTIKKANVSLVASKTYSAGLDEKNIWIQDSDGKLIQNFPYSFNY